MIVQHQSKISKVVKRMKTRYAVLWDLHGDKAVNKSRAQSERLDGYLDGFTDGVLIALGISSENVYQRFSSQVIVRNLGRDSAIRLARIIGELYRPINYQKVGICTIREQGSTCHYRHDGVG